MTYARNWGGQVGRLAGRSEMMKAMRSPLALQVLAVLAFVGLGLLWRPLPLLVAMVLTTAFVRPSSDLGKLGLMLGLGALTVPAIALAGCGCAALTALPGVLFMGLGVWANIRR